MSPASEPRLRPSLICRTVRPRRLAALATALSGAALLFTTAAGASEGVAAAERLPTAVGGDLDPGVRVSSLPRSRVPGPSRKVGTYSARILIGTAVRGRPGSKSTRWYARTRTKWSGNGQRLMVLGSRRVRGKLWLKVRLPVRPNDSHGWIPRDRVQLARSPHYLVVDRSRRYLTIFRKGRKVRSFRVVVGEPSTPTPLGLFAIQDRARQPNPRGFIGPWAVPLTAHSEELRRYDGGPGLVALHGRAGASLLDPLGSARSHGCVRMGNGRILGITRMMLGTAVRIKH